MLRETGFKLGYRTQLYTHTQKHTQYKIQLYKHKNGFQKVKNCGIYYSIKNTVLKAVNINVFPHVITRM